MKDTFLKFIDRSIGSLIVNGRALCGVNSGHLDKSFKLGDFHRFLIIRPGGLGDMALLLPLLRHLKKNGRFVGVLGMKRNLGLAKVFLEQGFIDKLYSFESPQDLWRCKTEGFDCVIDSEQSFNLSAVIGKALKPKVFVGFDTGPRRTFYDLLVSYHQERYEAESFLDLIAPFGERVSLSIDSLILQPITVAPRFDIPSTHNLIISAGSGQSARALHLELVVALLSRVSPRFDHIYAIGTKEECGLFTSAEKELKSQTNHRNFTNLCGSTSLGEAIYLMQHAAAWVGADSGPLHLATLSDVKKIVAIFGPGIDKKWALPNKTVTIVNRELTCRPCNEGRFSQTPPCPYNVRCIRSIDVEDIVAALVAPSLPQVSTAK